MDLHISTDDGQMVHIKCVGEIRRELPGDPLESLLGRECYGRQVLIDLGRTTFIDSSGIGWLVVSHRRFRNTGGMLILHSVPAQVYDALFFVRSHAFLTIVANEAEARTLASQGSA
jgi:anti-anti-sigma factor